MAVTVVALPATCDNPDAVGFWTRLGHERSDVVVMGRRLDG